MEGTSTLETLAEVSVALMFLSGLSFFRLVALGGSAEPGNSA